MNTIKQFGVKTVNEPEVYVTEATEPPPDHSIMVLLIDDQTTVAKAVQHLFREASDIDLLHIADPAEAIKVANAMKPTVILQDLTMPSIDGLDLLKLLRANPATTETPIIVLSSEEDPQVKKRAFAAGANDYLVKLPDKIELIARVRYHSKACRNRIQRDEVFKTLRESQQQLSESNLALIVLNQKLEEAKRELSITLRESEQRAKEAVQLTELVDILQSCQTVDAAYKVTETALRGALPSQSGALCMTMTSRNIVEAVVGWGDTLATEKTFHPDDCWALRRGKTHRNHDPTSPLRCQHVSEALKNGYVCVPLAAQGETLGVLYLEFPSPSQQSPSLGGPLDDQVESLSRQATAAGERISLALANLRLRDVLRSQSIRDPLTGLFNRRYMEESLERELRRAARNDQFVGIVMLDVDHFKQFNDTFGHQAGDTLLRVFGDFLNQRTRGQDIACRYGGEEFTLILAGATLDAARQRAELLREDVNHLVVQHAGKVLGLITLSIGVSAFPVHGATAEELLHAADQALYRAKSEGRDRVVSAPPGSPGGLLLG
jgi:diguanylate cyclase (GGDEF)-like protein